MKRLHRKSLPILLILLIATACAGNINNSSLIAPAPSLPPSTPWELAALSRTPAMSWTRDTGPVRSLTYRGEPYNGAPTSVFAYYASPATLEGRTASPGEFPAIVCVHGGAGKAFSEWAQQWAERGYAAIAMDLSGRGADSERLDDGGPDQTHAMIFNTIDDPITGQWPYHAVANVILAHSLIRSFPEIDTERIGVTGISWGGYLTCITAGLDNRFAVAVPVYGCGFLHENSCWLGEFSNMTPEQRDRWTTLWDPSRYVGSASMPMFFLNGTNDLAYYLDIHQKTCQLVTSPRNMRITVNMPHGHIMGWAPTEIARFMDQHLRGGPALPLIGLPARGDSLVSAPLKTDSGLSAASLNYTTGNGPINALSWISTAADIGNGRISAKTPPQGTTMWFFIVKDEYGAVVSSEVVFERH
jgi:hypothetical protein